MVHFIQPVALFSEQTVTTLLFWDFDVDHIVGMPDNVSIDVPTAPSVSVEHETMQLPTAGDCVEVCGANDCDFLVAMPGLNKGGELSLSEKVARDILGDADEFSTQRAAWEPAPQEKCEASQSQKKLRKRDWYPDSYGLGYENYALPPPEHYSPEEEPYIYQSQHQELPLEYYEPRERDYEQFHKPQPKLANLKNEYPETKNFRTAPQTQQSNRNVRISNDNAGSVNGKEKTNNEDKINAALTDPPRRTVGAVSPATKPNSNKGTTKRYPVDASKPKGRQSSKTESYSNEPLISFQSARADDVPDQYFANDENQEYSYAAAEVVVQPSQAGPDPLAPKVSKIEHPDGSIEYSFGVTSGEVSVYNEGEAPKKPSRQKSVISSLKSQLGIDDDVSRAGWTRKSKRHLVPENKPSAKTVQEKIVGEDGVELKESVQRQRTPNQKADFMRTNGNRNPPKKSTPKQAPPPPPPSRPPPQPEEGSEEAEAAAEQEIADQQKAEYDRLRRLSLKQFYRDLAAQEDKTEVSRDKWAEQKITEEAQRVAAENAQKKREDRARMLKEKEPKVEDME